MFRCTACGTRLSGEATRCWLCHAAAPVAVEANAAELPSDVIPVEHVWAGPLDRTSEHGDPDPVAAAILGRHGRHMTFGQRVSSYVLHALGRRQTVT
jgi:hypothetical protein